MLVLIIVIYISIGLWLSHDELTISISGDSGDDEIDRIAEIANHMGVLWLLVLFLYGFAGVFWLPMVVWHFIKGDCEE